MNVAIATVGQQTANSGSSIDRTGFPEAAVQLGRRCFTRYFVRKYPPSGNFPRNNMEPATDSRPVEIRKRPAVNPLLPFRISRPRGRFELRLGPCRWPRSGVHLYDICIPETSVLQGGVGKRSRARDNPSEAVHRSGLVKYVRRDGTRRVYHEAGVIPVKVVHRGPRATDD